MEHAVLGIDIAKADFHVALLIGESARTKSFPNNPKGFAQLDHWLANQHVQHVHACLEATGSYGEALAVHLADAGNTVSIVNPARIKGFARSELQRTKTDAIDAGVSARFCKALDPHAWVPPPMHLRELQALVRRRDSLQATRVQELSRQQTPGLPPSVQHSVNQLIAYLDTEIARLEKLIAQHIDSHPDLRAKTDLLRSIPGIGDRTAAVWLGELPDMAQFTSAKQLAAFVGLSPQQWQSGSSVRGKTRLAKAGNARMRKALYFPAIAAARYNSVLSVVASRLAAAGKTKMTIIGAIMRKLLHLGYALLKSGRPFDPCYVPAWR